MAENRQNVAVFINDNYDVPTCFAHFHLSNVSQLNTDFANQGIILFNTAVGTF